MAICNICNGETFGLGPGGRLSMTGQPPRCTKCNSLERHRCFREVMLALQKMGLLKGNALQFSQDRSVEPAWFDHHEVSVYQGSNSLDLQKIARDSASYDVVICNHVLEHVQYDNAALNELARVVKPDGFIFLSVPDPIRNKTTRDWGFPREDQHGHFRIYGADFSDTLQRYIGHMFVSVVDPSDPVTNALERVYLIAQSYQLAQKISTSLDGRSSSVGS